MSAVQITGCSGAGKTTIAAVLARRSLAAIDADDDPLLARFVDAAGNEPEEPEEPDFAWLSLILLATRVLPVKGSVAVAVATLVIAALFNPLRKRVQHAVDQLQPVSAPASLTGRMAVYVATQVMVFHDARVGGHTARPRPPWPGVQGRWSC